MDADDAEQRNFSDNAASQLKGQTCTFALWFIAFKVVNGRKRWFSSKEQEE